MTNFEIIILACYVLFAFGYTVHSFGIDDCEHIWSRLLIVIAALTLGPIYFPGVLAEDVFYKLNTDTKKYGQQRDKSKG